MIVNLEFKFSKQSKKFLSKLNKTDHDRILEGISKLPKGDIVKLKGTSGYRLRVGDFVSCLPERDKLLK